MATRKESAGILIWRRTDAGPEVLLVHPGGPFWARKDLGAWSIPKGELDPGEDRLPCAIREVHEEIGVRVPAEATVPLGEVRQASGKRVHAWAWQGDVRPVLEGTSTFELEWPPKSGKTQAFPEVDRAEWFALEEARRRILAGQAPLLDRLAAHVASLG